MSLGWRKSFLKNCYFSIRFVFFFTINWESIVNLFEEKRKKLAKKTIFKESKWNLLTPWLPKNCNLCSKIKKLKFTFNKTINALDHFVDYGIKLLKQANVVG